jgi:phosphoribosyl-ATP pyrophosphohydrolase/phosphoribosyl-AMP cyclohydrolase
VGEEAVELVIEAKDSDHNLFVNEAADLLYHFMVLLEAKDSNLAEVAGVLEGRDKIKK